MSYVRSLTGGCTIDISFLSTGVHGRKFAVHMDKEMVEHLIRAIIVYIMLCQDNANVPKNTIGYPERVKIVKMLRQALDIGLAEAMCIVNYIERGDGTCTITT